MKLFKTIRTLSEQTRILAEKKGAGMDPLQDPRSAEERAIDAHIASLIDTDNEIRKTGEIKDRLGVSESDSIPTPLEYNMNALIALKGYYYGKYHGEKNPEHAKNIEKYSNVIQKELPHLNTEIHRYK